MDRFRAAILNLDNILDKEKEKAVAEAKGKKTNATSATIASAACADDEAAGQLAPKDTAVKFNPL